MASSRARFAASPTNGRAASTAAGNPTTLPGSFHIVGFSPIGVHLSPSSSLRKSHWFSERRMTTSAHASIFATSRDGARSGILPQEVRQASHGQKLAHPLTLGRERVLPIEVRDQPRRLGMGRLEVALGVTPAFALRHFVHQQIRFNREPRWIGALRGSGAGLRCQQVVVVALVIRVLAVGRGLGPLRERVVADHGVVLGGQVILQHRPRVEEVRELRLQQFVA